MDRNDELHKDTNYSPASDTDTDRLQDQESPALQDPEIDETAVTALPGTGGPDDEGDVDVDPDELNL
jgi:hypothetical protein